MRMNPFDLIGYSMDEIERAQNRQAMKEAEERQWPSDVLEDILDADEVKERTPYKPNPIIFGGMC